MPKLPWLLILLGLCWFVMVANVWRVAELGIAKKLSASSFLSHVGLAVLLAGLIFSRGFERKGFTNVQEGRPGAALGYTFEYLGQTSDRHDRGNRVRFRVTSDEGTFVAAPGLYYVVSPQDGRESPMVWPHIQRFALHDVYIAPQPEQSEASGVVTALGEGVIGLAPGDRVAIEPAMPCMECEFCRAGNYNVCPGIPFMGTPPTDGALRDYISWPAHLAVKMPESLSFDEIAMLEPMAIGVHAVKLAKPRRKDVGVVLGAGAVGLSVLQAAKAAGMRCVAVAHTFAAEKLTAADLVRPRIAEVALEDLRG